MTEDENYFYEPINRIILSLSFYQQFMLQVVTPLWPCTRMPHEYLIIIICAVSNDYSGI